MQKKNIISMPTNFIIALTNRCNFSCPICPTRRLYMDIEKKTDMSDKLFNKIISEIFPYAKHIHIGGSLGESTISHLFPELLNILAKNKKILSSITTNGFIINRYAEQMLKINISMQISFDGFKKDMYSRMRGDKYDTVVKNIKYYVKLKKKLKSSSKIYLRMTAQKENVLELLDLIKFSKQLMLDGVCIGLFRPNFEKERYHCLYYHQSLYNSIINQSRTLAKSLNIDFYARKFNEDNYTDYLMQSKTFLYPSQKCPLLWTDAYITEKGKIIPCCANTFIMGDLKKSSLRDIWYGKRYQTLRKTFNSSKPNIYCRNCIYFSPEKLLCKDRPLAS